MWLRRGILALAALPAAARAEPLRPVAADTPEGAALVALLRGGGHVLFFRHADTRGANCDITYRVGDRAGQRNISPDGRAQAARIGERLAALGIPVELPVLAGPVYRARDTAEAAFGAARVQVTDSLLADDFSGPRLDWVLAEHRRLFSAPVAPGVNRVLVGHRTPAIMVAGDAVGGARLSRRRGAGHRAAGRAGLPGGRHRGIRAAARRRVPWLRVGPRVTPRGPCAARP